MHADVHLYLFTYGLLFEISVEGSTRVFKPAELSSLRTLGLETLGARSGKQLYSVTSIPPAMSGSSQIRFVVASSTWYDKEKCSLNRVCVRCMLFFFFFFVLVIWLRWIHSFRPLPRRMQP